MPWLGWFSRQALKSDHVHIAIAWVTLAAGATAVSVPAVYPLYRSLRETLQLVTGRDVGWQRRHSSTSTCGLLVLSTRRSTLGDRVCPVTALHRGRGTACWLLRTLTCCDRKLFTTFHHIDSASTGFKLVQLADTAGIYTFKHCNIPTLCFHFVRPGVCPVPCQHPRWP